MSVDNPLNEQDQRLLAKIETILSMRVDDSLEEDSLYGLCAHLAGTMPQPPRGFQERLWETLAAKSAKLPGQSRNGHYAAWSQRASHSQMVRPTHTSFIRPRVSWITVILLILGITSLIFVPPVRAFAGEVIHRLITLGEYSWVEQGETPLPDSKPTPSTKRWVIETDLGMDFGATPQGDVPVIRSAQTLSDAQVMAGFPLWQPTYLTDGYIFHRALLPPNHTVDRAYLFFTGPGRDIVLILTPVGEMMVSGGNEMQGTVAVTVTLNVIYTNGSLEETTVHGQPAAWVDGKMLVWEANGMNFVIGGLDLNIDEAIRIAESLKPLE